jgi:hypothetical protein
MKEVSDQLVFDGTLPKTLSVEDFGVRVRDGLGMWKKIATTKKIVAE